MVTGLIFFDNGKKLECSLLTRNRENALILVKNEAGLKVQKKVKFDSIDVSDTNMLPPKRDCLNKAI